MIFRKIPPVLRLNLVAFAATAMVLGGCAKLQDDDEADATSLAVESVVGNLNTALSDGEQSASVASNGYRGTRATQVARLVGDLLIAPAHAASCGLERFSPAIGSSSCAGTLNDSTVVSSLSGCTAGASGQFSMSGSIRLAFDSPATCDSWINGGALPTSGSVVRTSSAVTRSNPNGSSVVTSSDAHQNYLGESVAGGVKTTFGASGRSLEILGLHRTRTNPRGRTVFDHSIHTLSPIVASGSQAAGTRSISSGSVRVDHNLARYSMTTSVSGLSWTSNCCHPASGQMVFSLSGALSGTVTADFNTGTCGEVNVTKETGETQKVQLSSCD